MSDESPNCFLSLTQVLISPLWKAPCWIPNHHQWTVGACSLRSRAPSKKHFRSTCLVEQSHSCNVAQWPVACTFQSAELSPSGNFFFKPSPRICWFQGAPPSSASGGTQLCHSQIITVKDFWVFPACAMTYLLPPAVAGNSTWLQSFSEAGIVTRNGSLGKKMKIGSNVACICRF